MSELQLAQAISHQALSRDNEIGAQLVGKLVETSLVLYIKSQINCDTVLALALLCLLKRILR